MTQTENLVKRLPTEMGGLEGGPFQRVEHEYAPWEKRCHALANVLDLHKIINTEEKRRGIADLGSEMVEKLSYYERWIVVFSNVLLQKRILTPDELATKMDEVAARFAEQTDRGTEKAA